ARRDLGEHPARRRAVGAHAELDDVLAAAPADLLLVVVARGVAPRDPPALDRRVPGAQGRAVHVRRADAGPRAARRHDPGVLHATALEDPRGVELAAEAAAGDVDARIADDLEVPAADQEAVEVRDLGDLGRPAGGQKRAGQLERHRASMQTASTLLPSGSIRNAA